MSLLISLTALPLIFSLIMVIAYFIKIYFIVENQVEKNSNIPKIKIQGVRGKRFERLSFETY